MTNSLFDRPMTAVDDLLWTRPDDAATLKNWDKLATENPINAAIAQDDESGEMKKGAHEYETLLREVPGGTVLDLGCGYGRVAKYVLPRRAYGRYIGLDRSSVMLRVFAERYRARPEEQKTPLTLVRGEIDALPFPDGSIDAVVTSAVWIHNPKALVRRSVAEVRRVLKPGGKLLVFSSFPNAENPAYWQESFYSGWILPLLKRQDRNGPVRTYAESEIQELFADFGAAKIEGFGCRAVPTHLLPLHRMLNLYTWKQVATPINEFVCRRYAKGAAPLRLRMYHDVIASR
jgi:ubiquinone/menaquinone biosynthesis C-methylase UbiE